MSFCCIFWFCFIVVVRSEPLLSSIVRNYNKYESPTKPTKVMLGAYVNSFHSISETTMDYSLNIYLRQQWNDPRLRLNKPNTTIKLHDGMWNVLWIPDVFFRNEKRARFHYTTTPNRLMNLNSSGTVFYVIKLSLVLDCQMCLKKFPMDEQRCPMKMESFGYTSDVIYFEFMEPPVEIADGVQLPQFELRATERKDCSQNYLTGNYSCLQITFVLERSFGYYLTQMYIPTVLIIVLSWVGFWISIDAVPARVSLGLLTVLTITTQRSAASSSLPRVSYVKAMDVWMATCLVFVFASFIEFAIISFVSNRMVSVRQTRTILNKEEATARERASKKNKAIVMNNSIDKNHRDQSYDTSLNSYSLATDEFLTEHKVRKEKELQDMMTLIQRKKAEKIDTISRWLFPLLFTVFNISYWFSYLYQEDSDECKN